MQQRHNKQYAHCHQRFGFGENTGVAHARIAQDFGAKVVAEVASDLAEEFGRLEGVALVNGNGVKKPVGILAAAGVPEVPLTAIDSESLADGLVALVYSLPAFYRANGAFMMNSATLGYVMKLKDGQGNSVWRMEAA